MDGASYWKRVRLICKLLTFRAVLLVTLIFYQAGLWVYVGNSVSVCPGDIASDLAHGSRRIWTCEIRDAANSVQRLSHAQCL
jgi:hypothetical protein